MTITSTPTAELKVNTDGTVTVTPGTQDGTYYIDYTICENLNPANCSTATVTVEVSAASIAANNDSYGPINGYTGNANVGNALTNDSYNGFTPASLDDVDMFVVTPATPINGGPVPALSVTTGIVSIPAQTPAGTYSITYQICEELNPTNCDQALITVEVSAASILAVDDDASGTPVNGYNGGTAVSNVLDNDLLNGVAVIPAEVTITAILDPLDGVTLNTATGEVTVDPATQAGTYYITYHICENLNPTNCDDALITVKVIFNTAPITFNETFVTCENTAYSGNVLINGDYDPDGTALFISTVAVEGPSRGTIDLLPDGSFEYTPESGYYGTDRVIVSVCDNGFPLPSFCTNDTIFITVQRGVVVNLGDDQTICETDTPQLHAIVLAYSSLLWETSGDGTFTNVSVLDPTYTPGVNDLANGIVEICLTAGSLSPCVGPESDCRNLIINYLPEVSLGNDTSICLAQVYHTSPVLVNVSDVFWVSGGDGYFADEEAALTDYYPGPLDVAAGSVELCLYASGIVPCFNQVFDCMNLDIYLPPVANAGEDASICISENYQLNGAASNIGGILWTTNGDGTFSNTSVLNPVYDPGTDDVLNGSVVLCLEVTGLAGCSQEQIKDCMTVFIINVPQISGLDVQQTLDCADYDFDAKEFYPVELAPEITNCSGADWTTSGDGYFDDPGSIVTAYHLGLQDIWSGGVRLCIYYYGLGNCQFLDSTCIDLKIPIQIISVSKPGWNGISSYVDKSKTLVPEVMAPVVNELIIMINRHGLEYWPEPDPPINQLGSWGPVGYKAKFNSAACLPIYGDTLNNQSFVIDGAFTYLPVLTNVTTNINELLGANASKVLLIYDWPTNQIWTNFAADFQYLHHGKAYLLVRKAGSSGFTVTFNDFDPELPISSDITGTKDAVRINSPWNDVTNTMQPHIILFTAEATAELQPGDIIGVFDKMENCVGMAEFESRESFFKIVAMGDDPMTAETEGYQPGDQLNYRLYRPATGETYDIVLTYNPEYPSSNGKFAINAVSLAETLALNITSASMLENEYSIKVFPIPATEVLNVVSDVEVKGVSLVNFVGQKVMSQTGNSSRYQLNVSDFTPGMYFLKIEMMSGNVITRRVSIY